MSKTRLAGTSLSALASGRPGPVAGGGDELGGIVDLAGQRVFTARVGAEAPARLARDQLALGALGGTATRTALPPRARLTSAGWRRS